jgi:hypothetical protein
MAVFDGTVEMNVDSDNYVDAARARPYTAWTPTKVLCAMHTFAHLLQAWFKHGGRNPRGARNAPYIGVCQVPRDVVSPGVPQATGPHFADASMHVQHALLRIMMNLLPDTDRLVSACDPLRTHDSTTHAPVCAHLSLKSEEWTE